MLKLCKIVACPNGTLGLHLSRAPWDPYPWVSGVQEGSRAYQAGVRIGDTVLELNGSDVLGQKISDIAMKIRTHWESGGNEVTFLIWRNKADQNNINQQSLQKFATCLQNIAQLLECPICLEVVKPPGWQCCNGHVLCNSCRGRTVKCPICRVTLGPRGRCLLSDKLFTLLAETFPCDGNDKKQEDTTTGNKVNNNHITSDRRASAPAKITSPKGSALDDKQIISIKVDFKSPQQEIVVPLQNKKNYYQCPTGKSCDCSTTKTATNSTSNNSSSIGGSSGNGSGNIRGDGQKTNETITNYNEMFNQWDVLTHLRRNHHLTIVQFYATYGEQIQVEFINNSISCISIASDRLPTMSSLTPQNVSAIPLNPIQTMPGGLFKPAIGFEKMLGGAGGGGFDDGVELFFVARVPIETDDDVDIDHDDDDGGGCDDNVCPSDDQAGFPVRKDTTTIDRNGNCENSIINSSSSTTNTIAATNVTSNPSTRSSSRISSTSPDTNKRCAIFIWYCGSENNVKKFQTVIECKRSGTKWTGCIHPLTMSWKTVQRRREYLQLKFDVVDFLDIVIKIK